VYVLERKKKKGAGIGEQGKGGAFGILNKCVWFFIPMGETHSPEQVCLTYELD